MKSIAVIGAGITGITTAYELYSAGYEVTVIEANDAPSMVTSFANGGQLSACNGEVWTNPGTIWKGLKYLLTPDAPLLVNPKPSWHKLSWFAEFIGNIPNYERNTIRTVEMAIAGRDRMREIGAKENIQYDRLDKGILHVYRDRKSFETGQKVSKLLAKGGLERQDLSLDDIEDIEPTLNLDNVYGGIYTSSDSTGDIFKFTSGLAKVLERKGVNFLYGCKVETITNPRGEVIVSFTSDSERFDEYYDGVVLCAGVASHGLAKSLGDKINIYPVKGYSITVPLDPDVEAPHVSLLDESAKIVTSRIGDRLRVAGTAEFNGYNLSINQTRVAPLVKWTMDNFPQIDMTEYTPWAGLRPMAPNMLPYVGKSTTEGVYYNTGHGHLGWTLGVSTAVMIKEIIEQDK